MDRDTAGARPLYSLKVRGRYYDPSRSAICDWATQTWHCTTPRASAALHEVQAEPVQRRELPSLCRSLSNLCGLTNIGSVGPLAGARLWVTDAPVRRLTRSTSAKRGGHLFQSRIGTALQALIASGFALVANAAIAEAAATARPNILVIFGDDVGWANLSLYNPGVMGYATPNIDRIGREGAMFTDHYAQPSCTAGRAAFITGQYPIRSGMTTVGLPGDTLGIKAATPTLAEVLKPQGYATGQFGKNHLGDRNERLPTVHGFDEFYGNLYHLNEEEQPEQFGLSQGPGFLDEVRSARRAEVRRNRDRRPDGGAALRPRRQAALRGHRPAHESSAWKRWTTSSSTRPLGFIKRAQVAGQAVVRLAQHQPHAPVYAPAAGAQVPRGDAVHQRRRPLRQRPDRARHAGRRSARDARSPARSTTRSSSTRPTTVPSTARRSYGGTTPFRGEKMTTYEGGVRVPCWCAGRGTFPPAGAERHPGAHGPVHDAGRGGRRPGRRRKDASRSATSTSTASTTSITGRASRPKARGPTSSTTTSPS